MKKMFVFLSLAILGITAATAVQAMGAFPNYGEIRPSGEATRLFESYKVVPNYTYYISGSDLFPDALIAVDKAYTLTGDLWKEVEMTPKKLKEIVGDMHVKSNEVLEQLHGFDILDNKGKRIGIWYSILRAKTSVKMEGEGKVLIYTPPLDVWRKDSDRVLPRGHH